MLGNIGTTELIIILVILLLLFGSRLPTIMRSLGKSVNEFKRGMNDITEDPDAKKDAETKKDEKPTQAG